MTEQQPLHSSVDDAAQVADLWRGEVQARLERYKRRRGRRIEGAFTMRFPFPANEAVAPEHAEQAAAVDVEQVDTAVIEATAVEPDSAIEVEPPVAQPEAKESVQTKVGQPDVADPEPETEREEALARVIEMPPRPRPRRKVIAFPSPSYAQQQPPRRLADPVQPEQLRILDVPEELQAVPATPFLEGLLDAPPSHHTAAQREGIELPCAAAKSSTRLGAAMIDACMVLAGVALFVAVASRFTSHELPAIKFLIAGAVGVSVLLWASYQYLFLVYGGRTLGMQLTRVGLHTFKGRRLAFRQRQYRVMALYLSVLSLGMGVLWSLVDVDRLCWHDRISQTFPAACGKS